MASSIRIGRLSGIPIRLHWSLFPAVPVLSWIIGSDLSLSSSFIASALGVPVDTAIMPGGIAPPIVGMIICLAIYASFFVYQVATVLVARGRGIEAGTITLHAFGGVSSLEMNGTGLRDVLPIALAGPVVHLALGITAWSAVYAAPSVIRSTPVAGAAIVLFGYLAILNLALFIFSLLPGLPMNGGRLLQAWLGQRMPLDRATRISALSGRIIALLFILLGGISFNIILVIIGILVFVAAAGEDKGTSPARYLF